MYAIRYFRTSQVVDWYRQHGISNKPVGWVKGKSRFMTREDAQKEANHINALGSNPPVEVVTVSG